MKKYFALFALVSLLFLLPRLFDRSSADCYNPNYSCSSSMAEMNLGMPGMNMSAPNNTSLAWPNASSNQALSPGTVSVSVVDFSFSPNPLTIAAGTMVVWSNGSNMDHTVTADDGSFDSGALMPGMGFSHTFSLPGTFRYYCRFHGAPGGVGMSGIIIVTTAANNPNNNQQQFYQPTNPGYYNNTSNNNYSPTTYSSSNAPYYTGNSLPPNLNPYNPASVNYGICSVLDPTAPLYQADCVAGATGQLPTQTNSGTGYNHAQGAYGTTGSGYIPPASNAGQIANPYDPRSVNYGICSVLDSSSVYYQQDCAPYASSANGSVSTGSNSNNGNPAPSSNPYNFSSPNYGVCALIDISSPYYQQNCAPFAPANSPSPSQNMNPYDPNSPNYGVCGVADPISRLYQQYCIPNAPGFAPGTNMHYPGNGSGL